MVGKVVNTNARVVENRTHEPKQRKTFFFIFEFETRTIYENKAILVKNTHML